MKPSLDIGDVVLWKNTKSKWIVTGVSMEQDAKYTLNMINENATQEISKEDVGSLFFKVDDGRPFRFDGEQFKKQLAVHIADKQKRLETKKYELSEVDSANLLGCIKGLEKALDVLRRHHEISGEEDNDE